MLFIIDNSVSPVLAAAIQRMGHEARHVRDMGLSSAMDAEIAATAAERGGVIVTADTDFGEIIARSRKAYPSVILYRLVINRPEVMVAILDRWLPGLLPELEEGAIVVVEDAGIRIHRLD